MPLPHDAEYEIEHHIGEDKDMNVSSSSSSDSDGSGSEAGDRIHGRNTGAAADTVSEMGHTMPACGQHVPLLLHHH